MNLNIKISCVKQCVLIAIVLCLCACKDSFLEVKPSTDIVSPKTLDDFQQMLDYFRINNTSGLPFLASDEYEIPDEKDWLSLSTVERNSYIWTGDLYEGQERVDDWNYPYEAIFYANSVMKGMGRLKQSLSHDPRFNHILGQAYFVRAFAFFDLAKNFAPVYDKLSAATDKGIPLKLTPDVDELVARSTLEQTYGQLLSDLQQAINLLERNLTVNRNRANKPAAYALGARICLSMRNYQAAERYADSCLKAYDKLIDYNTIDSEAIVPFLAANDENLLDAIVGFNYQSILYMTFQNVTVSKDLLQQYDENDLRRDIFFADNINSGLTKFKRGYSGASVLPYAGLATDEIYLIKAECAVRRNDLVEAARFLNLLLSKRYRKGKYVNKSFSSADLGLKEILIERRKELVWRAGLRWDDIRRLNKEGAAIQLKRIVGGKSFTLSPNSPRYIFPIPTNELVGSGVSQNLR